jgi:hypothetical protein
MAGAALAAILGLLSVSYAQKEKKGDRQPQPQITRTHGTNNYSEISGILFDQVGASIPRAKVKIKEASGKETLVTTNDDGAFKISNLAAGTFSLEISRSGFKKLKIAKLDLKAGEDLALQAILQPNNKFEVVGLLVDNEPLLITDTAAISTTITRRQIENLPY